jgi:ADP-ribose pyrophosphatase YjhB (NUDIX family)
MNLARHFRVCPRCAGSNFALDCGDRHFLCRAGGCGLEFFLNSAAAVGVVLQGPDGRILLLRRAHDPGRGQLGLPGGFVDEGESAEAAACREVREETGLVLEPTALRYFNSGANVYPFRGVTYHTLDLFFTATHPDLGTAKAEHEVAEMLLLRPVEIDLVAFAFPTVRTAVSRFLHQT